MQNDILAQHPNLPLRVYAVWFNMIFTDRKERWPRRLMPDPRVAHLWDEGKTLGRWYSQRVSDGEHILWDTFLLYPPRVDLSAPPDSLLALGSTIVEAREDLRRGIESLARARL